MTQPVSVFQAERVPSRRLRIVAGCFLWPVSAALFWIVAKTFPAWGLEGGPLDVRPVGLPLVLLVAVVLLLGIQFGSVRVQQLLQIGLGRRRALTFWATWTILGIASGVVQTFANLPPDVGFARPTMLLTAYVLSMPFGYALWIRFNN